MTNDREQALHAGADDFDSKPIHFERLIEKIEDILGQAAPIRD
jgi:DNA-binding response OmpR family regulator